MFFYLSFFEKKVICCLTDIKKGCFYIISHNDVWYLPFLINPYYLIKKCFNDEKEEKNFLECRHALPAVWRAFWMCGR